MSDLLMKQPCVYILASQRNGTLLSASPAISSSECGSIVPATSRFHQAVWCTQACLLRAPRDNGGRDPARETPESLAAHLEAAVDRRDQSAVVRPVPKSYRLPWALAFARVTWSS